MAIYQGFHVPNGGSRRVGAERLSRMHAPASGLDPIQGCSVRCPGRRSRQITIVHNGRIAMRKVVAIVPGTCPALRASPQPAGGAAGGELSLGCDGAAGRKAPRGRVRTRQFIAGTRALGRLTT